MHKIIENEIIDEENKIVSRIHLRKVNSAYWFIHEIVKCPEFVGIGTVLEQYTFIYTPGQGIYEQFKVYERSVLGEIEYDSKVLQFDGTYKNLYKSYTCFNSQKQYSMRDYNTNVDSNLNQESLFYYQIKFYDNTSISVNMDDIYDVVESDVKITYREYAENYSLYNFPEISLTPAEMKALIEEHLK